MTHPWDGSAPWLSEAMWGALEGVTGPPEPPPTSDLWHSLEIMWTGWDGSVWMLSDERSGVYLTAGGTRGLTMPTPDISFSESAGIDGAQYEDLRYPARDVFWPLWMYSSAGSEEWIAKDRAFHKTLHPRRQGMLSVRQATGEVRSLMCRFVTDNDHALTHDPTRDGWELYGINLVAEWPFWEGSMKPRRFPAPVAGEDFHSTDGDDYVISIGTGSDSDSATITNPGDEAAWPVWRVQGPFDSAEVGVGDIVIELPALADGESITVDTHPRRLTAVNQAGEDVSADLGANTAFDAPIEPGAEVTLTVDFVSPVPGAEASIELTPLYLRAW